MHTAQAWTNAPCRTRFLPLRLIPQRLTVVGVTDHRLGASRPTGFHLGVPLLPGRPWGEVEPPPLHQNCPTVRSNRIDSARLRLPEETSTIRAWSRQPVSPRMGTAPASVAAADISATLPEVCLPNSLVTPDQREVCPLSRRVMLPCGATPIRPITGRHSLSLSSFTRCPVGLPCGSLSLDPIGYGEGGDNRLTTFRRCTRVE